MPREALIITSWKRTASIQQCPISTTSRKAHSMARRILLYSSTARSVTTGPRRLDRRSHDWPHLTTPSSVQLRRRSQLQLTQPRARHRIAYIKCKKLQPREVESRPSLTNSGLKHRWGGGRERPRLQLGLARCDKRTPLAEPNAGGELQCLIQRRRSEDAE